MRFNMALGLALKNIKANKVFLVPFYFSVSIMGMLFFIMFSLSTNNYVLTRHKEIIMFIGLGTIIAGIFFTVVCFYSNRVISKSRNKEFALYGILGLEKKHIAKILFLEYLINFLIISFFAIFGGYVFGKLTFLGLNYILQNEVPNMEYSTSTFVELLSILFFGTVFLVMYLISVVRIGKSTPIELMTVSKKSEKEPKVKWIIFLLGVVALGIGYYLALKNNTKVSSFENFFKAVLFVIFGTYFLFVSLSIFVLKLLKNNKKYFYKSENFISISGMLYRMKSNAVGLASIAILCTSIILTIAVTTTIHISMNDLLNMASPKDYSLNCYFYKKNEKINSDQIKLNEQKVLEYIQKKYNSKNIDVETSTFEVIEINGNEFKALENKKNDSKLFYAIFQPLENYNKKYKTDYALEKDEVIISKNFDDGKLYENIKIDGVQYKVKYIENIVPKNVIRNSYKILTADYETFLKISNYFEHSRNSSHSRNVSMDFNWDSEVKIDSKDFLKDFSTILGKDFSFSSREEVKKSIAELDGGFLFLGVVVSIIFLVVTILITYYKQISEGFEDRSSYQTMKKVGISEKLIKKSIQRQIIWMFFLPLIVAIMHCLVSTKILKIFLSNFNLTILNSYLIVLFSVILVFVAIYFVIFKITSRVYYKIVS